jgi:hypothetical protein
MVPGAIFHFNPEPVFAENRSVYGRGRLGVRLLQVISVEVNGDSGRVNLELEGSALSA